MIATLPAVALGALPQQSGAIDLSSATAGAIRITGAGNGAAGFSVAAAGDVNGDGNGDLVIGAPFADDPGTNAGAAFVVFGPVKGSIDLANLGSDGFVIRGAATGDLLGYAVTGVGDITGDGRSEILVGAPFAGASDPGAAYVVFGRSATSVVDAGSLGTAGITLQGPGTTSGVGKSVATVPDMNGDARPELVVGGPDADTAAGTDSGAAWVVFNRGSGSLDLGSLGPTQGISLTGPSANAYAGSATAGLGDLSGDGRGEVAIGAASAFASDGAAFLTFGALGGTLAMDTAPGLLARRSGASQELGQSVAAAGDQDGDGTPDLLVGSRGSATIDARTDAGVAYMVLGRSSGPLPDLSQAGAGYAIKGAAGERAGYSVAGLGDVDGSGGADFAVSAPCAGRNALANSGSVFVVFRNTARSGVDLASLPASQGYRVDGPQTNASCPAVSTESDLTVAGAGDVTGDGRPDVVVGTPRADDPSTNAGGAWIVLGYGNPAFTLAGSAAGTVGTPLSVAPSGIQRTGAVSFAVDPALPAGLQLNPATGAISGTPTSASPRRDYTVTMSDLAGSVQRSLSLEIAAAPAPPVEPTKPTPTLVADADGDGVPDALDRCPSPKGSRVNAYGCPKPYRTLSAKATLSVANDGHIRALRVVNISSRKATLRFTCVRCQGAPRVRVRPPLTARRVATALRRTRTTRLNARSQVVLTLTEPGTIGWRGVFVRGLVLKTYCLPLGSTRPRTRCDATPGSPGAG